METISYIHYGSTALDPDRFVPVHNRFPFGVKPEGGLWASRTTAGGWKQWCLDNDFHLDSLKKSFRFHMKDQSRVYVIHTIEDAKRLPQVVLAPEFKHLRMPNTILIDFEKCRKMGIDGIELRYYEDDHAENAGNLYLALYTWDCDSMVVLNPDAIVPD